MTDLSHSNCSEVWKPIPEYEGLYDASNLGRIRSSPGKVTSNRRYPHRVWQSRIMKQKYPRTKKRQDGRVSLWKDGEEKDYLVSRLVASTWLGSPDDGMTVNHIDGNYQNNSVTNLEWITRAENIRKGFSDGLFNSIQKPIELISESGVKNSFESFASASRWLGRHNGYVSNAIKKGQRVVTSIEGAEYFFTF